MKVFLLYTAITLGLLSTIKATAQNVAGSSQTPAKAKPARNVFVEFGGAGLGFTFNYDQRFKKQNNGLGFRIGIGGSADGISDVTTVPLQLNYLWGNNGSYFEAGGGINYLSAGSKSNYLLMGDDTKTLAGTTTFAYRWQPVAGGVLFRASFDPVFSKNGFFPFGGLSMGYTFAHTQVAKPKQRQSVVKNDSVIRAKNIFFEGGGPSFKLSVNYDTRFGNRRNGLGGRAGIGYMSLDGYRELVIPVQLNYLVGRKDKFLEIGAGASYLTASDYLDYRRFLGTLKSTVVATGTVGYRYQPQKGGCIAGISFNPLYNGYRFFPFGGVTLGYTLK
jgi:hypothetical protein